MIRAIPLLVLLCLLGSCRTPPQKPANLNVWYDESRPYVLFQANLYEVVAFDVVDGSERWRYRRDQVPPAPFGRLQVPTVVCPPEWTGSGNIVLPYTDGIHVVSASNGGLLWKKDLQFSGHCPTVTADSGIVVVVRHGTLLQKLAPDGRLLWEHDFWKAGVAVTKPQVVAPSGDTLLRTNHYMLSISPAGQRNWMASTTAGANPS